VNMYEHISIQHDGYLVTWHGDKLGTCTYACTDRPGLDALILHLTGRSVTTFPIDKRGLPQPRQMAIAEGLHIYGSRMS
jgi:hypothetical protein